jgi:hypothetical protein
MEAATSCSEIQILAWELALGYCLVAVHHLVYLCQRKKKLDFAKSRFFQPEV